LVRLFVTRFVVAFGVAIVLVAAAVVAGDRILAGEYAKRKIVQVGVLARQTSGAANFLCSVPTRPGWSSRTIFPTP
jgi:hypothetical protein